MILPRTGTEEYVKVTDIDEYGSIGTEAYFWDGAGSTGSTSEIARGVPLTPEWLERCGFVKLTHLGKKEHTIYVDEGLSIEACEYDQLIIRLVICQDNYDENINIGAFIVYRDIKDCKHVHQLQNLYFALTGEELKIKLP